MLRLMMASGAILCGLTMAPVVAPVTGSTAAAAAVSSAHESAWFHTRARLRSDTESIRGQADYRERERRGELLRRVQFHIQQGTPNTAFDVMVNGVVVGSITTNEDGEGKLYLRTYNVRGQWGQMPDTFPMLLDGDVIDIGTSTGVMQER